MVYLTTGIIGLFLLAIALRVLGDDATCATVSFGGHDWPSTSLVVCHPDQNGDVPNTVAGLALSLCAGIFIWFPLYEPPDWT